MSSTERFLELAAELIGNDAAQLAKRSYKRRMRGIVKVVKTAALMLAAAIVIPVAMITGGLLFGPRGYEGVIAAPLAVFTAWGLILFIAMRSRATPRSIARSDMPRLPASTEEWLDLQRATLPAGAQATLDTITQRLEALGPQAKRLDAQAPGALELRRLLAEELPDLVHGYQKVPRALQAQPLHGGASPDRRLIEGLSTIDEQLGRMQDRLAADDLHSLAIQQRYLEIKYKEPGEND